MPSPCLDRVQFSSAFRMNGTPWLDAQPDAHCFAAQLSDLLRQHYLEAACKPARWGTRPSVGSRHDPSGLALLVSNSAGRALALFFFGARWRHGAIGPSPTDEPRRSTPTPPPRHPRLTLTGKLAPCHVLSAVRSLPTKCPGETGKSPPHFVCSSVECKRLCRFGPFSGPLSSSREVRAA
ncbi:hypothetical protein L1887_61342 [Cichorium endivia]|nr:hypothetical protein L1887_61342 [Cichorium endivia]